MANNRQTWSKMVKTVTNSQKRSKTIQKIYISTFLRLYIPTSLNSNIPTFLHSYNPTFLHSLIPTFLPSYIHTFLHSYICTFLYSYVPIFLRSYISTVKSGQNGHKMVAKQSKCSKPVKTLTKWVKMVKIG